MSKQMKKTRKDKVHKNQLPHGKQGGGQKARNFHRSPYKNAPAKKTAKGKTLQGTISLNSKGIGYVSVLERDTDLEIAHEDLHTALHGDTVEVIPLSRSSARRERGRVTKIIKRAKTAFVGIVEKKGGDNFYLHPDDRKSYIDIHIVDFGGIEISAGKKALVALTKWNSIHNSPEGKLVRLLGEAGEHETEMSAIVLAQGFDTRFPHAVEAEAKRMSEEKIEIFNKEAGSRRDFRNIATITIDPVDAKDFDDAISVEKLKNGDIEIGVHIADVSAYVKEGDAIDVEAEARGTSIYLVDRTVPMLPEVLSNDLCSLNPNEDKLAFSAVFVFDKNGSHEPKTRWFGQTIINSDKRFSYREAQDILDRGQGDYCAELKIANDIALALRKERFKHGGIDFDSDEIKFVLDKSGKPLRVYKKERIATNLLIEDLMLLANREVATHFNRACEHIKKSVGADKTIFLYRVHDVPNPEKVDQLQIFLKALGHEIEMKDGLISARTMNDLFKKIADTEEEHLIKTAAIRSMAKAVYSVKNIGHFGLAFTFYTHFTSPIRRYPDLLVHRILKRHLAGEAISTKEFAKYERLAFHASERESAAVEAERDSVKYKQVEYMKEHIGEEFDGLISGITEWGMYIEERKTLAEGLVRVRDLTNDFYEVTNHGYTLKGQKTGARYTLGDTIRVKLIGADLAQKTLDWKVV
jgi:ribonuclease R